MSNEVARVGIVVRTKNRPEFLRRTLEDIAAQTFSGWLVHIVNDGGEASAVDAILADAGAVLRGRAFVTHHDTAHGRSAAANRGLRGLDTDYVVLHDDDDLWHPSFLQETVDWLDRHQTHVGVVTRTEIVYEAERGGRFVEVGRVPFWPDQTGITYSALIQVNRFVPISFLYRRAVHEEVGFYREDVHAAEDWEFNLRVALNHTIGYLSSRPLAFWHQRAGVEGELGNSMFALAEEHDRFDSQVRDEALRAYVRENGPGLPLYLTRFIQDEIGRQLDDRRSLGQRLTHVVRDWRRGRRRR